MTNDKIIMLDESIYISYAKEWYEKGKKEMLDALQKSKDQRERNIRKLWETRYTGKYR